MSDKFKIPLFSAIAPFLVTMKRARVISYTEPVETLTHTLFIKNPSSSINIKAYASMLTNEVWIAVGFFCLICPLILYLVTK